jgi:hypothetical protein
MVALDSHRTRTHAHAREHPGHSLAKAFLRAVRLPAAAALPPARGVGGPAPAPAPNPLLLRAALLPLLGRNNVGAQAHVRDLVEAEEVGQEGAALEHVRLKVFGDEAPALESIDLQAVRRAGGAAQRKGPPHTACGTPRGGRARLCSIAAVAVGSGPSAASARLFA